MKSAALGVLLAVAVAVPGVWAQQAQAGQQAEGGQGQRPVLSYRPTCPHSASPHCSPHNKVSQSVPGGPPA